jgi:hypothetical protein
MATWTINDQNVNALAVKNLSISYKNLDSDEATFTLSRNYTETPFLYNQSIVIKKDAEVAFRGFVYSLNRIGSGKREEIKIVCKNVWERWKKIVVNDNIQLMTNTGVLFNGFIANFNPGAGSINPRTVVQNLANNADSANAQAGTINVPNQTLPWDQRDNVTVADVIREMVQLRPYHKAWFNYATTRPSFNVDYVSLTPSAAFNIPVNSVIDLDVKRRDDLPVQGIVVHHLAKTDYHLPDQAQFGTVDALVGVETFPVGAAQGSYNVIVKKNYVGQTAYFASGDVVTGWGNIAEFLRDGTSQNSLWSEYMRSNGWIINTTNVRTRNTRIEFASQISPNPFNSSVFQPQWFSWAKKDIDKSLYYRDGGQGLLVARFSVYQEQESGPGTNFWYEFKGTVIGAGYATLVGGLFYPINTTRITISTIPTSHPTIAPDIYNARQILMHDGQISWSTWDVDLAINGKIDVVYDGNYYRGVDRVDVDVFSGIHTATFMPGQELDDQDFLTLQR